jgi:nucleoside 2-deoxyribosyltransferase
VGSYSVYLAGPIANVTLDDARGWRRTLTSALMFVLQERKYHVAVYDPANGFTVNEAGYHDAHLLKRVQDVNDQALSSCDVLVARVDQGIRSLGTEYEIELAANKGKAIVAFGIQMDHLLKHVIGIVGMYRSGEMIERHQLRTVSPGKPYGVAKVILEVLDVQEAGKKNDGGQRAAPA